MKRAVLISMMAALALAGCGSSSTNTSSHTQSQTNAAEAHNDQVIKQAQGGADNQAALGADKIKTTLVAKLGMNSDLDFYLNHRTPDSESGDCYVKLGADAVNFENQSANILYSPNGKDVVFVQSFTNIPLARCLEAVGTALGWTSGGSSTTSTTATTTAPAVVKKRTDCNALGITEKGLREGACTKDGDQYYVVNRGHTAHLKTLTVSLQGLTAQDSLSNGSSESATARGKFVIATLTLTNKTHSPETWENGQASLAAGPNGVNAYSENFEAENGPDEHSCLWVAGAASNGGLQPGETVSCDVVFDIPTNMSATARGSEVFVTNFGDNASSATDFAVLRTYH
jgi:uncharacterized protein YceK